MIIPDANLLLYATDRDSQFHAKARKWWDLTRKGETSVGFCAPAVFAFVRISTHPGIFHHPLKPEDAFFHVENWMQFPTAQWLIPDESHFSRVKSLLLKAGTAGNIVTDAQIAAYGQQYSATIYSADLDFVRFGVKWLNPLLIE